MSWPARPRPRASRPQPCRLGVVLPSLRSSSPVNGHGFVELGGCSAALASQPAQRINDAVDAQDASRYDQIALQLTGHAWAVVAEVRRCCTPLPPHAEPRVLAEVVLEEADRRLARPPPGTVRCAQMHARQVRARYERLPRLQAAQPAATPP
ncbi:DUF6415 family natural product biosynthesis protein [Streptomyces lydicus]|uniref:DUF6415 family natural product biosynthesis protein n=1 Tax=Streptomyces lydicus TaxID=47763 RepID=UPI0036B07491